MKDTIVYKLLMALSFMLISPKSEILALSEHCNNNVKRKVRNNYKLEREYWLEVRE